MRIQIPTAVKKGDPAILNCWYDTEGDLLYAVKWYKGGQEFYRYAPNEIPVVKTFPIGNLTVKVSIVCVCSVFYAFFYARTLDLVSWQPTTSSAALAAPIRSFIYAANSVERSRFRIRAT